LTPSYGDCARNQETYYTDYDKPQFFEIAHTFFICEGVSGDANGELLTALATIAVAAFTLTLWLTSAEQARLTRESISLAQSEFNATHRPEIVIHSVQFVNQQHPPHDNPVVCVGALVTFFNKGTSDAFITARTGIIGSFPTPLTFNINPGPIDGAQRERVGSGSPGYFFVDSRLPKDQARAITNAPVGATWDGARVFCLGVITYADKDGNQRHTGFVRTLNVDNPEDGGERWMRVAEENPYEYAY
jgi:hypothetical protein